jgi:hypothetical protein
MELERYRREADDFFKSHPQSPLTPEQCAAFTGMVYYPPNPDLDLIVEADEFEEKVAVMVPRTGDKPASCYLKWGTLVFEVAGERCQLLLLYSEENNYFFLGFWDATSGAETYGGGRYIDPEPLGGRRFRVDFNRAYNPYCAYNDSWSCLLPPPENRLRVRIEAGQKAFK